MSGLEILGAVASAAQLTTYVFRAVASLSRILETLKHGPKKLAQHAHQISRLVDIVLYIKDNELVHTRLVFSQLEQTIKESTNLRILLEGTIDQCNQTSLWKKYRSIMSGKKEELILEAIQNLEREKTGLTLCLTAAQSKVLQDVRREVRRSNTIMSDITMSDKTSVTEEISEITQPSINTSPNISCESVIHCNEQSPSQPVELSLNLIPNYVSAGSLRIELSEHIVSEDNNTQTNNFGSSAKDVHILAKGIIGKGKSIQVNNF